VHEYYTHALESSQIRRFEPYFSDPDPLANPKRTEPDSAFLNTAKACAVILAGVPIILEAFPTQHKTEVFVR
jgi:hypothetical protein